MNINLYNINISVLAAAADILDHRHFFDTVCLTPDVCSHTGINFTLTHSDPVKHSVSHFVNNRTFICGNMWK